jgi:hypothetical protein
VVRSACPVTGLTLLDTSAWIGCGITSNGRSGSPPWLGLSSVMSVVRAACPFGLLKLLNIPAWICFGITSNGRR